MAGIFGSPMWRREVTTPELDRAEQQWWEDYGDVEERYCWVQTDWVQQFLRGRYLRDILRGLGPSHSVVELGCGTGWLTFRLARAGAAVVTGVDNSPSQIARAKAAAEELTGFLDERFTILRRSDELSMAHLVAQEVLIAQLSQPRLWGALLRPILWLARALDRRLMRIEPRPSSIWIMQLWECVVRDPVDSHAGAAA
jgi:SAM-dependent methyltransferase